MICRLGRTGAAETFLSTRNGIAAGADVLEVEGLGEPVEQGLAAAENHRRDDDREFVDDTGIEALADYVRATADGDVLVTRDRASALDRLLESAGEVELTAVGLLLRAVGDDEDGDVPRVLVSPVPGGLVHPTADDDRAGPRHRLVQELERLARGFALRLVVVAPGPTEDPVVQPLAALPEALAGPVARARDVAVHRGRDRGDHRCHGHSPVVAGVVEPYDRQGRPNSSVRPPRTPCRNRGQCRGHAQQDGQISAVSRRGGRSR